MLTQSVIRAISLALSSFLPLTSSHTASEWSSRTIYQVLIDRIAPSPGDNTSTTTPCHDLSVYCGGTWLGLQSQLDYISDMGFDALWISPMLKNLGNDYHGYAFLDLYQVNEHFGTENDFINLINSAHKKNIWIMLDVVGNHVAPVDLSYEQINPFNQSEYYHSKCQIEDWTNQTEVEYCRLANLPDLDQNHPYVRSTLINWVSSLQDKYQIDGIRIDTVPEVHPDFWLEFASAANMYAVGEVFNGDIKYVSSYQQYMDGVLSYPLYFTMLNVFAYKQSMYQLESLLGPSGTYYTSFKNVNYLGTFIDNHDNPRFLYNQNNQILYKNALTMTLFSVGIPIIYYGTEQGYSGGADPQNRESLWPNYNTNSDLYQFLKTLIHARKSYQITTFSQIQRYAWNDFYSFSRGDVLVCLTNSGGNYDVTITMSYIPYNNGQKVCNVLNTNDCLTVNDGKLTVVMNGGLPKVYVPA